MQLNIIAIIISVTKTVTITSTTINYIPISLILIIIIIIIVVIILFLFLLYFIIIIIVYSLHPISIFLISFFKGASLMEWLDKAQIKELAMMKRDVNTLENVKVTTVTYRQ